MNKKALKPSDALHLGLLQILGDGLSNSPVELHCYSRDASQVRGLPQYVARPQTVSQISRVMALCHRHSFSVTPRGAGSGLSGGAVPVKGGLVMDLSGMNAILEVDLRNQQVLVEPGVVQSQLNKTLQPMGFTFPPNPGSSEMCTIGGMIANNASGMRSVKYGTTRNYVLDLVVVLADGRIVHTGSKTLKISAGYDLTRLMVGSEGTLGIITSARLRIVPLPRSRRMVLATFRSAEAAGAAVVEVFSRGVVPSACEILDKTTLDVLVSYRHDLVLPHSGDLLLFEVDGSPEAAAEEADLILESCSSTALEMRSVSDDRTMADIWEARSLVGAAVSRLDPRVTRVYEGEDVGVPMSQVPAMIIRVEQIAQRYRLPAMKYGHIGDGNLHTALFIDVTDKGQWERLRAAAHEIHMAALELGGTVSAEHGIGAARARYMQSQWSGALDLMRAIKNALDPENILNPGKLGLDEKGGIEGNEGMYTRSDLPGKTGVKCP